MGAETMSRGNPLSRILRLCLLLLLASAGAGCARAKCTSSAECKAGEVCGGASNESFQCLKACATGSDCPSGTTCANVTSADCTECGNLSSACVASDAGPADTK